jgi:hypothetical protein
MQPGEYEMSNGFSLSGNNNIVDLTGAYFYWTVGEMSGNHLSITGDGNTVRGGEFEDVYYDGTSEITDFTAYNQDRENFANAGPTNITIDGDDNRIVGLKMTVRGSYPYGYGSMYGINQYNTFGLDKHCGLLIRAKNTEIDSVEVQQRAFCHAIFMQSPADNTVIKNTLVEGRVRSGADMLAEPSNSLAGRADYMMHYDRAGAAISGGASIQADEFYTLTEDGIRLYDGGGGATVENTTVKKTRGGIRLYFGTHATVINSTAVDCGSTNFNLPSGGTITGSSGNFAYAPLSDFRLGRSNQTIELTILPSPHATGPHNIADIQGNNHEIVFHRTPGSIDTTTRPIVVTGDNSTIRNETEYRIILESGASGNTIYSCGEVIDNGSNNEIIEIEQCELANVKAVSQNSAPQPVRKMVIMNNTADIRELQIYDLQGRLKTGTLPTGLYFYIAQNIKN